MATNNTWNFPLIFYKIFIEKKLQYTSRFSFV